jgi:hypothetical protein
MGYDDTLFDNYTNSIRTAVQQETSFKAGQHLVAAGRQFVRDSYERYPDLDVSEESINFFLIDIIGFFGDNNVDFDWKDLANLLLLDKELFLFTQAVVDRKTEFSDVWDQMSDSKKALVYRSLEIVDNFFSNTEA